MDSSIPFLRFLLFFAGFHLMLIQDALGGLILEDGYSVNTVLNGYKSSVKVVPHSILHQSPPSDLFVLLDSVASTFYTVSMSGEIKIEKLAGNGQHSYTDGDLNSATFNKPKSFAVDYCGNVYVADQSNHAIRKITKSGVTTIAGGYSKTPGNQDGPAQNATFSKDFLLAFVPERCALMIADHGNSLVRQINLKPADCTLQSRSVLGTTSVWILALVLSCIIGIVVGFVLRPYVLRYEGSNPRRPSWTWTHCLMNLERQIMMLCCVVKNAVVKSPVFYLLRQIIGLNLSILSLMFSPAKAKPPTAYEKPSISLLDLDGAYNISNTSTSTSMVVSPEVNNQLKDLLNFDGSLIFPTTSNKVLEQEQGRENINASSAKGNNIDDMMLAHLANFNEQASFNSHEPLECSSGLVKRK